MPLKLQTQNPLASIGNLYSLIYAPADDPKDVLWGADNGDSLTPGVRDFGINHKLP